jgi:hypothetical protein
MQTLCSTSRQGFLLRAVLAAAGACAILAAATVVKAQNALNSSFVGIWHSDARGTITLYSDGTGRWDEGSFRHTFRWRPAGRPRGYPAAFATVTESSQPAMVGWVYTAELDTITGDGMGLRLNGRYEAQFRRR